MALRSLLPRALRPYARNARSKWKARRDEALFRRLDGREAIYVGIHDGATLNLAVTDDRESVQLWLVQGGVEISCGAAERVDSALRWTVDMGALQLKEGTWTPLVGNTRSRSERLALRPQSRVSADVVADASPVHGAQKAIELELERGLVLFRVSRVESEPWVESIKTTNDGRYQLTISNAPGVTKWYAQERDRGMRVHGTFGDGSELGLDVSILPKPERETRLWDMYLVVNERPVRLRVAPRDLCRPDKTISVPGYVESHLSDWASVWKPYVAFDGGLTLKVVEEPVESAS